MSGVSIFCLCHGVFQSIVSSDVTLCMSDKYCHVRSQVSGGAPVHCLSILLLLLRNFIACILAGFCCRWYGSVYLAWQSQSHMRFNHPDPTSLHAWVVALHDQWDTFLSCKIIKGMWSIAFCSHSIYVYVMWDKPPVYLCTSVTANVWYGWKHHISSNSFM